MSTALGPGAIFGGYRVESRIGRGGMGVVYRATDLSLERPVALKLIAPELAEDERFRERFLREPRLAASLDHPNVVPIYEAGERDGHLYLAMRFVEGEDLKTSLREEGKLAPERTIRILAQVAGALDAAHRRGLVHRDVKPANVLLDEEEHVYLTDFGITKQLGGASTDTGRVVGTLDYLAPEQIRGETVDARTDCYSLACVLYECLSGTPPFRRQTEAETMWAHMQDEPAPLRGYPRLDPVIRKALAKERDERYGSCAELIEAASAALGVHAPARQFVPPVLVRRRRAILVAGLLVLAVAVGAGIVALTGGEDGQEGPLGNGIAAIDAADGTLASFTAAETAPGNVAVGEGAVWVLDTENKTVSRIDPETTQVVRTFQPPGVPTDIAVGEGALWVGNAGGGGTFVNVMASVSRIDPRSLDVTETTKLPDRSGGLEGGLPTAGLPRLVVGAGAVWAVNPDFTVSRIDPDSGRLDATIDAEGAWTIAAGEEGVWFRNIDRPSTVTRIDVGSNSVAETISVGANNLWGVAVGDGSVWATALEEGVLWRIEPGDPPVTRTIDVGVGVTFVAFGEKAVWTGNYVDGFVSRVDPSTNEVTGRASVSAPQALAVGNGAAWVSVAGGVTGGALTTSACSELASGGGKPDVLIASDFPLQGPDESPRAIADAIRFVLERRGFRAGEHTVGYQSCDDSTLQTGTFELRKCAANASAYAAAKELVAVIGPYNSFCAQVEIPILNRAPGGPLATIGPSSTYPGLTRGEPLSLPAPDGYRGEPRVYYPTGVRNYARVTARDDLQGRAHAVLARQLRLESVYVLEDGSPYGEVLYADPFRSAAGKLGVRVAGSATWNPDAKSYDALADRVARSGADGVVLAGSMFEGGDRVLKALRARLGTELKVMAGDITFVPVSELVRLVGPAANGVYLATTDLTLSRRDLTPAGRRFIRDFSATPPFGTPLPYVLHGAQAAEVVLDAIERSDGSRASVLDELRQTEVKDGMLGSFSFDRNGDITPAKVTILRVTGRSSDLSAAEFFSGAVVDRVLTVPATLAR